MTRCLRAVDPATSSVTTARITYDLSELVERSTKSPLTNGSIYKPFEASALMERAVSWTARAVFGPRPLEHDIARCSPRLLKLLGRGALAKGQADEAPI